MPTNQEISKEILPITKLLEDERRYNKGREIPGWSLVDDILPKVRTLELASIARAKEEERQRIVGILEEMEKETSRYIEGEGYFIPRYSFKEAIERISNNP